MSRPNELCECDDSANRALNISPFAATCSRAALIPDPYRLPYSLRAAASRLDSARNIAYKGTVACRLLNRTKIDYRAADLIVVNRIVFH